MSLLRCLIGNTEFLCTQCWRFGPLLPPRGMSHGVARVDGGNWNLFQCYSPDGHSKIHFVQRSQDSCLVRTETSGICTRLGRIIQRLLEVRWETKRPFLVSTEILGFLSIFKKSQASAPFEALNSWASRGVKGCDAPCLDEAGNWTFSRDCTEGSDIPLSCEMKDEPAFKRLHENPTFFRVRESRYPLHMRQQIQGPSHIPIAEGRLLLRYLWEGGLPL